MQRQVDDQRRKKMAQLEISMRMRGDLSSEDEQMRSFLTAQIKNSSERDRTTFHSLNFEKLFHTNRFVLVQVKC